MAYFFTSQAVSDTSEGEYIDSDSKNKYNKDIPENNTKRWRITMKKTITIISAAAVLLAVIAGTTIKARADMKVETTSFSVTADRSRKPGAYCRNADGTPISTDYSTCDNFCISQYADGNASIMSYDGAPAFCIGTHQQNAPYSLIDVEKRSDIPFDDPAYAMIFRIAAAGSSTGTSAYGLNDADLYYVTQCAIRAHLYNIPTENLAFFDENGNRNDAMTAEFIRLRQAAEQSPAVTPAELVLYDEYAEAVPVYIEDSCYYRYGPYYTYNTQTEISYYTVNISEENEHIFVSSDQSPSVTENTSGFSASDAFYIYIDAVYTEEAAFTINTETVVTDYSPTVYIAYDKSYQDIFQLKISEQPKNISTELKLKNTNTTGEIMLNKRFIADELDITDASLISQPRFTIKNTAGKYVSGIISNGKIIFDHFSNEPVEYALSSDSTLYISGLPTGEYYISEVQGAKGYTAENAEISINNTHELDTCEIINVSETTTVITTPVVTTTEALTTTGTTTSCETTSSVTSEAVTSISTTETTSEETTVSNTTAPEITITLPEETTLMTDITKTYETATSTETTTTASVKAPEVQPVQTVHVFTPKSTRIPYSPSTGDASGYLRTVFLIICASSALIFITKK